MRILLIVNPLSGRRAARETLPILIQFFKKNKVDVTAHITSRPGDASRTAKAAIRSKKYDVITSCGGDGNVNEVINGMARSKIPLGIIPLGTENVLAREFSIPFNALSAAKVIIGRNRERIDLGKANGRYFSLMAGVGYDAHVASRLKPLLKRLLGRTAYHVTAVGEIFNYKTHELDITIDGERIKGTYTVAGNTKLYGGELRIRRHADIKDGLLDVCVFTGKDMFGFLRFIAGTFGKRHLLMKDVKCLKAKKIIVRSDHDVRGHVDCELIGNTPIKIQVCPAALTLMIPAK